MKAIDHLAAELLSFKKLKNTNPLLDTLLKDPSIGKETKKSEIIRILEANNFSTILKNSFSVIAENGRLNITDQILNCFDDIMKNYAKTAIVKITTFEKLQKHEFDAIKDVACSKILPKGFSIEFLQVIDPNILGGMIIEFKDKTIDMSVLNKLKMLSKDLEQTIS